MLSSFTFLILFFVLGLVAVLLEIVTPGGVLALLGGIFLLIAVAIAFSMGVGLGLTVLVLALMLAPMTFMIGMRLARTTAVGKVLGLNRVLDKESGCVASDVSLEELVGRRGRALTTLRPAGLALIEGRRVDVVTRGFMIANGVAVKVVQVEGNRVVVVEDKGAPG